jgi:microsomal dipeptidase-like Zn-dependent dipeptidase
VEDARILGGKLERVDTLYRLGIRILNPLWKGETCIGGSHDTDSGLTRFGKESLSRAASLGMILDISHASEASAQEIFEIAEKANRPVIASHSNAYEVCPVSRNLKKSQIQKILSADGIIGINLHRHFLKMDGNAKLEIPELPQLIALLPLFIWIALMFTWRYVSYECATRVEDGTLSFARLFGKSRRVLWSCRVSELLYAAPDTPEARAHAKALAPHAPLHDYTSGADVPLCYLAVASVNEKLHLVRFDCYDELIRTLRFYNKSVLTK